MACTHPSGLGAEHGVLVWTFADLIQPDCILESPVEVGTFQVNPAMPHMVAGGCSTGQVILWDTSANDVSAGAPFAPSNNVHAWTRFKYLSFLVHG